ALQGHQLAANQPESGVQRVLVYSQNNSVLSNGTVATIPFTVAAATLRNPRLVLANVILSTASGSPVVSSNISGGIVINQMYVRQDGTADGFLNLNTTEPLDCSVIQATIDFQSWVNIATNAASGGYLLFLDTEASGYPYRFYRAVSCGFDPSAVVFADHSLETAVRMHLGIPTDPLLSNDMQRLAGLAAREAGITNLAGLNYALNLTNLDLYGNRVRDLSPLSGLSPLTRLELFQNQVSDLLPLRNLTNLTWLDLRYNQVVNLAPLAGLVRLEELYLEGNSVANLTPLVSIRSLRHLNLHGNHVTDLAPLTGLENLQHLDIRYNPISDLQPLTTLPNLTELLMEGQTDDLSVISTLTNLRHLALPVCGISNLTLLANLSRLESLDLRFNQIRDLSSLGRMTGLRELRLDGNPVTNLVFQSVGFAEGAYRLRLLTPNWLTNRLLMSADLREWRLLTATNARNGVIDMLDTSAMGAPQRFYRAVSP